MDIRIIIEPEYQNSFWCTETMKGLSNQAYLRKIRLVEMREEDLTLQGGELNGEIVVVIGTSINWINRIVFSIQEKGCLCLLVTGDQNPDAPNRTNILLLDYQSSMYTLLSHLKETAGDENIALFGVNPSSYADSVKKKCFPWEKDIYYNLGSIADCTNRIWERIRDYSAVICVNDTAAIYLLRFLLDRNVQVPENLRLISFGDSFLSRLMSPSITSVEQDFRVLGEEAVQVCSFLKKNPMLTINAFIKCPLRIRDSTRIEGLAPVADRQRPVFPEINFYEDEAVATIQALNRLLVESDSLDIRILEYLLRGETQEKTTEYLNLSLSSLRYRIRKLRAYFPQTSKNAMFGIIRRYLPAEALSQAEAIKLAEEQSIVR